MKYLILFFIIYFTIIYFNTTNQKIKTIYCDMDGVLADFLKGTKLILGNDFNDTQWHKIPINLYSILPKMKDADKLWNFINKYNLEILTAIPSLKRGNIHFYAGNDKINWMKTKFNFPKHKINIVSSAEKKNFANQFSILIDDSKKNIEEFVKNGGIGIHHLSAQKTIIELKKLGFT